MKQFFCGDVVPGCTAVFQSEQEEVEAILQQVATHAARDHDIAELSPRMAQEVVSHIRTAPSS